MLVFLFIDWEMDIPVVSAGLALTGATAQKTMEIPVVSLFFSTTSSSSPGSELKVPQLQFILCMPDIPVAPQ